MKLSIKEKDDEKAKPVKEVKKPASKKPELVLPDKEKSLKAKPWEAKARKTEAIKESAPSTGSGL